MLAPGDIVKVVNEDHRPRTIQWNSKDYVLEPGKDSFIPVEAAMLWFGDPRAGAVIRSVPMENGTRAFIPDRETEVRRLRIKYGIMGGDDTRFDVDDVGLIPNVKLYDLKGDPIPTVFDDPLGVSVAPAQVTISEQSNLLEVVRRQQEQINQLMGLVQGGATTTTAQADLPQDGTVQPGTVNEQSFTAAHDDLTPDGSPEGFADLSDPLAPDPGA